MDQRVGAAIAFMKANLHRKLLLREVADSVNLSPSHLRYLFKAETGTSLVRYLRQMRLERALHLLESTFLSVKQVASSVGMNGVSHFVRDFERAYRSTPARYAERYRKITQAP
jgi:transcriptional regulator GlxA family with amidase domain